MSVKNDCPMCGEAPSVNDSICKECRDYCNNVSDQLSGHDITILTDEEEEYLSTLGSLCIIIMPLLTIMEVA